ncbi:MAG: Stk1 family PASTA domain-containing Ser/Thr kinase, partial [Actinomycetota bacterium]|nr:Stk1 family PASTA domain-containing Ser/Thr kinase [Actinomycetota bacterium]
MKGDWVTETPLLLAGRYELGEMLGRGGMGQVYLGRDLRLSRVVAVKILRADLACDPSYQERFRREAQSAASLRHPAIVAVYDSGEDGDESPVPFIIMEYVGGRTLQELLVSARRRGVRLLPEHALEVTAEVLTALDYAHRHGVVHCDIKPSNVLLTQTGKVKVADFGIAVSVTGNAATRTQVSAIMGTALYLSPEQARSDQTDARSDLYSTGCLLYELLTGRPPFVGDSLPAVVHQHVCEQPQPPSAVDPNLSAAVDSITLKALSKARDGRYQTAAEFRADIERALAGRLVRAAPEPIASVATEGIPLTRLSVSGPAVQEGSKKQQHRWPSYWLVLALAVLALFASAMVFLRSPFGDDGGDKMAAPQVPPVAADPQVKMPNVTGRTQQVARSALQGLGLSVAVRRWPSNAPADQVLDQQPAGGSSVAGGSVVTLIVSTGPQQTAVPRLEGLSLNRARRALNDAGLRVGEINRVPSPQPSGLVISASTEAGERLNHGSAVDLRVASGRNKVPEVRGASESHARRLLKRAGFRTIGSRRETHSAAPGTVLFQWPRPGRNAQLGSTIEIFVAKRPAPASASSPSPSRTTPASSPSPSRTTPASSPSPSRTTPASSPS